MIIKKALVEVAEGDARMALHEDIFTDRRPVAEPYRR